MRIRQIKPEFWSDARLYGLDPVVKLIYIGLWNEADDSGFLRADPMQLALDLLRDVPLAEAEGEIRGALAALADRERIRLYRCGHAVIPALPRNQHLAGATKQVHSIRREHESGCRRTSRRRGSVPIRPDSSDFVPTRRGSVPDRGRGGSDPSVESGSDPREDPRGPADPRPVRLGKVRLGKRADAQENGTDPVETWAAVLRGPVNGKVRDRALAELADLGYEWDGGRAVQKGALTT